MAKYCQVERAMQLFEEARKKGITLNTESYNSIISAAYFLKDNYEMRWAFVMDLLSAMNTDKIRPNLYTLNATLDVLSTMGTSKNTRDYVLKTLSEFKRINIEPSLGSWYLVLLTFCKESM